MPQLIVERTEGSLADRVSVYRVYIDGEHRGDLKHREIGAYDVAFGTRSVKICIDRYSSPAIKVAVEATTRLVCKPNIAHALGMLSIISPRTWISVLEEIDVVPVPRPRQELVFS